MENTTSRLSRLSLVKSRIAALGSGFPSARSVGKAGDIMSALEDCGVHEFYAGGAADAVSVNGFGLGVAMMSASNGRSMIWAVHDRGGGENGQPNGLGLHELGLAPAEIMLVRARDARTLLGIGEDALRTRGVGAVLLSAWGEDRAFSLTASRRLALAAQAAGKQLFLARAGAAPQPSAAESRWAIRSAASTSLEGGAPGRPAFSATLLRHRKGGAAQTWIMEWDRERRSFVQTPTLHGGVVPLAAHRPAGAAVAAEPKRRIA